MSLLFMTMVTNAMWYHSDETGNDQVIRLGPIVFSAAAFLVSIFSSLMVIPINLAIVQLFRKSKPTGWEEEEVSHDERKGEEEEETEDDSESSDVDTNGEVESEGDLDLEHVDSEKSDGKKKMKKQAVKAKRQPWWRQPYPLPHWCVYVAWFISVASIVASAFFVIMYSFSFGKEKSEAWLSALVFSFTESVVVIQPLKVRSLILFLFIHHQVCLFNTTQNSLYGVRVVSIRIMMYYSPTRCLNFNQSS